MVSPSVFLILGTFLGLVVSYLIFKSNVFKSPQKRKAELSAMVGDTYRHDNIRLTVEDIHIRGKDLGYGDGSKTNKMLKRSKYLPFFRISYNSVVVVRVPDPELAPDFYDLCLFSSYEIDPSHEKDQINGIRPSSDWVPVWNIREFGEREFILRFNVCNYSTISKELSIMARRLAKVNRRKKKLQDGNLEKKKTSSFGLPLNDSG